MYQRLAISSKIKINSNYFNQLMIINNVDPIFVKYLRCSRVKTGVGVLVFGTNVATRPECFFKMCCDGTSTAAIHMASRWIPYTYKFKVNIFFIILYNIK